MEIAILGLLAVGILWVTGLLKASSREVEVLVDKRKVDHMHTYADINTRLTDEIVASAKSGKSKLANLDA